MRAPATGGDLHITRSGTIRPYAAGNSAGQQSRASSGESTSQAGFKSRDEYYDEFYGEQQLPTANHQAADSTITGVGTRGIMSLALTVQNAFTESRRQARREVEAQVDDLAISDAEVYFSDLVAQGDGPCKTYAIADNFAYVKQPSRTAARFTFMHATYEDVARKTLFRRCAGDTTTGFRSAFFVLDEIAAMVQRKQMGQTSAKNRCGMDTQNDGLAAIAHATSRGNEKGG